MLINILMDKLEKLNADLESSMMEKRTTNPTIGNVLSNAMQAMGLDRVVKAMGFPKHNEDYNKDSSFVGGLLKDV